MRLKKLMSLVLACAMLVSLVTVASAQDTEVFFVEDYSQYDDISDFFKSQSLVTGATNDGIQANVTNLKAYMAATKREGYTNVWGAKSTNYGTIGSAYSSFETNSFGSKTFRPIKEERAIEDKPFTSGNTGGTIILVPENQWDFLENDDETYVISYEIEASPMAGVKSDVYMSSGSIWSGAKTVTDGVASYASDPWVLWNFSTYAAATTKTVTGEGEDAVTTYTPPATVQFKAIHGNSHVNQWNTKTINSGEAHRIAVAFKYTDEATNLKTNSSTAGTYYVPTKIFAFDGQPWSTTTTEWNGNQQQGKTLLNAFLLGHSTAFGEEFANIKMYTIKSDDFKVYAETAENVALNTKRMRIYFSNPVSPATYAAPVVKKDGVAMSADEYSVSALQNYIGNVGGEIYSYVDVTFDALEEGTVYTVEFPETIANEIATTLGSKNVATFATKYPEIKVSSLAVVGAAGLVADGSLQKVKAELYNSTTADKTVALIYAVYTTGGQLADVVYVNDTVAADSTGKITAGVKMNAEGSLKTFVWDNITALKPYTGSKELAIAAPAVAE